MLVKQSCSRGTSCAERTDEETSRYEKNGLAKAQRGTYYAMPMEKNTGSGTDKGVRRTLKRILSVESEP